MTKLHKHKIQAKIPFGVAFGVKSSKVEVIARRACNVRLCVAVKVVCFVLTRRQIYDVDVAGGSRPRVSAASALVDSAIFRAKTRTMQCFIASFASSIPRGFPCCSSEDARNSAALCRHSPAVVAAGSHPFPLSTNVHICPTLVVLLITQT